jgi:hypothetical protein
LSACSAGAFRVALEAALEETSTPRSSLTCTFLGDDGFERGELVAFLSSAHPHQPVLELRVDSDLELDDQDLARVFTALEEQVRELSLAHHVGPLAHASVLADLSAAPTPFWLSSVSSCVARSFAAHFSRAWRDELGVHLERVVSAPGFDALLAEGLEDAVMSASLHEDSAPSLRAALREALKGFSADERHLAVLGAQHWDDYLEDLVEVTPARVGSLTWVPLLTHLAPLLDAPPRRPALVVDPLRLEVLVRSGVVTGSACLEPGDSAAVLETALGLELPLEEALASARALEVA